MILKDRYMKLICTLKTIDIERALCLEVSDIWEILTLKNVRYLKNTLEMSGDWKTLKMSDIWKALKMSDNWKALKMSDNWKALKMSDNWKAHFTNVRYLKTTYTLKNACYLSRNKWIYKETHWWLNTEDNLCNFFIIFSNWNKKITTTKMNN